MQPALPQSTDSVDIYDMSLEELSRLSVYSTTRTVAEEALSAPANLIVINEQQIKERGYKSLIDLMEDLPDFKVDRGVDPRWQNDVTLRGIRYMDKIILLLDGIRISSPTNEIIPVFENYPIHFVRQVEIFYGPASALYGADAFAGVINIVTKTARPGMHASGSVWGGANNGLNGGTNAMLSYAKNDFSITLAGQLFYDKQPNFAKFYPEEFEGYLDELRTGTFNTENGTISPTTPVKEEPGYPLSAYAFMTKVKIKDLQLEYFTNHSHNPSTTANSPHNNVYNEDQFFGHNVNMATAKYVIKHEKVHSSSQITYSSYNLDEESNFRNVITSMEPAYLYSTSWKLKFEQLFTFNISKGFKFTTGTTFDRFFSRPRSNNLEFPIRDGIINEGIISNSIAPNNQEGIPAWLVTTRYNNIGGLAQFNWSTKYIDASIGARLDSDDRYNPTFNPRFGIVAKPSSKVWLKSIFGTAFLAPSPQNIYDRYGTVFTDDGGISYYAQFFNLPNEELKPQKIITGEIGLKYFLNSSFTIDLTGYYSDVFNLISPVNSISSPERIDQLYPGNVYTIGNTTIPIDSIQINDNLGESIIFGSSISLNYQLRSSNGISGDFYLLYSFIDGEIDIDEEGPMVPRNLPGIAPHTLRLGATIRNSSMSVNTRIIAVGKQRAFNVNAVIDHDHNNSTANDTQYQELDGYVLVNATFNYHLNKNLSLSLMGRNLLNQIYRNVNIGASPDEQNVGGSANVEFFRGAPQYPIRLQLGLNYSFQ